MNDPSKYQKDIFADISAGKGNTVILARAGAGKTSTIVEGLKMIPNGRTAIMVAFNKSIAMELSSRAPRSVEVKTLHAHGFAACRRAFKGVILNDDKSKLICEDLWGPRKAFSYATIGHLVRIAKDTLVGHEDTDALDYIIDAYGIELPDQPSPAEDAAYRAEFVSRASQVLMHAQERTDIIDFSDMCWLPVVRNLNVWAFDRVFVDETQDLSPAQIELLLKCIKGNGRICAVGDDRQAIYGFRGADSRTIPNLIKRLDAKILPLSISYRCARAIVELARTEVPDFEAAPNAPDGEIHINVHSDIMRRDATPGDMIISRVNAPLLKLCLSFLKDGRRANVQGRDIGAGLIRLIERSETTTTKELHSWLVDWHARECQRLTEKERPTDDIQDKFECVNTLCDGLDTTESVIQRISMLFSETASTDRITLGSTHRLKGLEANRVWMLSDTYKPKRGGEEANLWYVAVTRAKTNLNLVKTVDDKEEEL